MYVVTMFPFCVRKEEAYGNDVDSLMGFGKRWIVYDIDVSVKE